MQYRISIAMATYNGERFIREQLESLCNQSLLPDELLISDDCSTDSTLEIIRDFQGRLNILQIKNTNNLGVNKNFEQAIRSCSGDYILLCDQDDIWHPDKIKILYENIRLTEDLFGSKTPLLVTSDVKSFNDSEDAKINIYEYKGEITGEINFVFSRVLHCQGSTMIFNRALLNILPPFPSHFNTFSYDGFIAMYATLNGKRKHLIQPLMLYRRHENNVIGKKKRKKTKIEKIVNYLSHLSYDLFAIPYYRLEHYSEFVGERMINADDTILCQNVIAVGNYYNATLLSKIMCIHKITVKSRMAKLVQIIKLLVTAPLRLFIAPPTI